MWRAGIAPDGLLQERFQALRAVGARDEALVRVTERIAETYSVKGHSRLALWLALAGWKPTGSGLFELLVEAVHAQRLPAARAGGGRRPRRLEARHAVASLNVALAAEPLFGPGFLRSVGLEGDAADQDRFRRWLIERLARLLGDGDREAGGA